MPVGESFRLEKSPSILEELLPSIIGIANAEKEALGFLPEAAYRDAIIEKRLVAIISAVSTHEVAGFIFFGGVFPHARLQQIGVAGKYRRKGIASRLLNYLISELELKGYLTIKAQVAEELAAAHCFYEQNSFEVVRSRPGGKARNRKIVIRVRELATPSLFNGLNALDPTDRLTPSSELRRRSAGDTPLYTFDLNMFSRPLQKPP